MLGAEGGGDGVDYDEEDWERGFLWGTEWGWGERGWGRGRGEEGLGGGVGGDVGDVGGDEEGEDGGEGVHVGGLHGVDVVHKVPLGKGRLGWGEARCEGLCERVESFGGEDAFGGDEDRAAGQASEVWRELGREGELEAEVGFSRRAATREEIRSAAPGDRATK